MLRYRIRTPSVLAFCDSCQRRTQRLLLLGTRGRGGRNPGGPFFTAFRFRPPVLPRGDIYDREKEAGFFEPFLFELPAFCFLPLFVPLFPCAFFIPPLFQRASPSRRRRRRSCPCLISPRCFFGKRRRRMGQRMWWRSPSLPLPTASRLRFLLRLRLSHYLHFFRNKNAKTTRSPNPLTSWPEKEARNQVKGARQEEEKKGKFLRQKSGWQKKGKGERGVAASGRRSKRRGGGSGLGVFRRNKKREKRQRKKRK